MSFLPVNILKAHLVELVILLASKSLQNRQLQVTLTTTLDLHFYYYSLLSLVKQISNSLQGVVESYS